MSETDTSILTKTETVSAGPPVRDSSIFGVSIRALIVLGPVYGVVINHLIVAAAVTYHALKTGDFGQVGSLTTISEPYYSIVAVGIGYYLGQAKVK